MSKMSNNVQSWLLDIIDRTKPNKNKGDICFDILMSKCLVIF